MKTPAAVQLLLPEMGGITGFYEARTDRVLCVRADPRQRGPARGAYGAGCGGCGSLPRPRPLHSEPVVGRPLRRGNGH